MKSKMQNVSFRSVDEFLDFLPEDELKITVALRKIVFDCIPGVREKLSYNVPFFRKHKNICFIWPASVLWGNKKSYQGVRFGFTSGYLLQDEAGYLDKGNRKQGCWKDFISIREEDILMMKSYLFEAALIDDKSGKKK